MMSAKSWLHYSRENMNLTKCYSTVMSPGYLMLEMILRCATCLIPSLIFTGCLSRQLRFHMSPESRSRSPMPLLPKAFSVGPIPTTVQEI